MRSHDLAGLALCSLLVGCAVSPSQPTIVEARQQVLAAEQAFAKTMAERDLRAFASFIADEAVFFSGPKPLRGKPQIIDWWARYYATPTAPFSWAPEDVEVLESGALALSSGPVRDPQGKVVARFTSIWRHEAPGVWRIIFDKGSEVCSCPSP